ncbi:MAG: hypothetical protein NC338_01300 [Firmicutes bacterium]|nr:hypothetical protein [Bacillota bacterium]MCM1401026.1 hypothetical protein [Bacteroides sp.]MCM1476945.1 hypothetical protein [Bacteroides sp.]
MKELKEIRINGTDILLEDNLVRSSILPEKTSELNRNIIFKGDTVVEGPIYGHRIEVRRGNIEVQGAAFAQNELYVTNDARGNVTFRKSVGAVNSVVSRGNSANITFLADINAKSVELTNAFVAGSIYADEVILTNCVVVGGVFATQEADIRSSMVGTFNAPAVRLTDINYLLLPSAFSIEPLIHTDATRLFNLSLADLGDLFKGFPQAPESGKIEVDLNTDELRSTLTDGEMTKTLRSYTVVGKVLAADLLDTDKFQNHFLLTAAALGPQLLKTYDLGPDANGKTPELSPENIRKFLFDILQGRIEVQPLSGKFNIAEITNH